MSALSNLGLSSGGTSLEPSMGEYPDGSTDKWVRGGRKEHLQQIFVKLLEAYQINDPWAVDELDREIENDASRAWLRKFLTTRQYNWYLLALEESRDG